MNKKQLASMISIEFALSADQAAVVIDNVFENIISHTRKKGKLIIPKFGEFKLVSKKNPVNNKYITIEFLISKKLAGGVNSYFDNLSEVTLPLDNSVQVLTQNDLSDEVLDNLEVMEKKQIDPQGEPKIKPPHDPNHTGKQRRLIPDDLVKLHKEITKEESVKASDTNLWG